MNGIGTATATSAAIDRATYFFLSYAHTPMLEDPRQDPDRWVKVFFNDLSAQIRTRISATDDRQVGFFDGQLPEGADWQGKLAEALGEAQVFVPLYSPSYLRSSWAVGELESFRRRLKASPVDEKYRHILPVLWIPVTSWEQTAETSEALEQASDIPAYAENGLRALCMLSTYQSEYRQILDRIAAGIVTVGQDYPLPQSEAPGLSSAPNTPRADAQFVVVVAAPTRAELPVDREPTVYTERGEQWRPFGPDQALPAANYVASTAERLGLATHITSFAEVGDALARRPAVLLIDPWIVSDSAGEHDLALVLKRLPRWVIPLVVLDEDDPQTATQGSRFAARVGQMLTAANRPQAKLVAQLAEFVSVMPWLVTEARRQYLKNAPIFPPDLPRTPRLRLGGTGPEGGSPTGTEEER